MNYQGDYLEDATVYVMFNTSNQPEGASCTITDFANTDVHIHKDDGLTQRNNAAGITVSVNFDSITGSHMIKIDTSDNTVAGFWVIGHDYFVRIEGATVDGATINAVIGHFSIENRFAEVDAVKIGGTSQTGRDIGASVLLSTGTGTGQLDFTSGVVKSNLAQILGTALTETGGYLAAGFKKLFNIATPVLTMESVNQSANNNTILASGTHGNAALKTLIDAIPTTAMRGTDDAALASGVDLTHVMGTILTEGGAGRLAAAIIKLFDVVTPLLVTSDAMRGTDGANTTVPDAAGVAATPAEVATALTNIHLDHLLAADYDPAAKPGVATALLNELIENDVGVSRFTANSLEEAPTGGSAPTVSEIWHHLLTGITTAGSIGKLIKDYLDAAVTSRSSHDAAAVKTAMEGAGTKLTLALEDTNELQTDWVNGGRLDLLLDAIPTTAMRGTDGANTTTPPTVGEIQAEMEEDSVSLLDTIRDIVSHVAYGNSAIQVIINAIQADLDNGTDGLGALKALIEAVPTAAATVNEWESQSQADPTGFHVNVKEVNGTVQTANDNGLDINAILERISTLTSGTAAVNTTAVSSPNGFVITSGTGEVNNEDSTHEKDGVFHSILPSGGIIDVYYIFDVGPYGIPVSAKWAGYLNAQGDTFSVYAWNWVSSAWDEIESVDGSSGTNIISFSFDLTVAHVGTGGDIGKVHIRGYSTDATKLATDRFICSYAISCTDLILDIQGTAFVKDTHSLPQCITATGFSMHDAAAVKTAMEAAGSKLTLALEDTNELQGNQGNWATATGFLTINDIADMVIEGTITLKEAHRVLLGVLAGKSDGGGTTTQHFRNLADTKNRVTGIVDVDGNRTGITLDLT